jgi:hypothetical protein
MGDNALKIRYLRFQLAIALQRLDLTLSGFAYRVSVAHGPTAELSQERDRRFESGFLQRRVRCEPDFHRR